MGTIASPGFCSHAVKQDRKKFRSAGWEEKMLVSNYQRAGSRDSFQGRGEPDGDRIINTSAV